MKEGLWVALSAAIAQQPCLCTENDACQAHELLDELFTQLAPAQP